MQAKENKIKKLAQFLLNPRFLFCFGLAWIITNGWAYILLGLGTYCKIGWMTGIASAYLALLWIPVTPEKIVTATIAIALLRLIFPEDKKTLDTLRKILQKAKASLKEKLDRIKRRKNAPEDN